MDRRVLGVIVAGGGSLESLGVADEAALTPFGGKYRFVDFALANLANSGVVATYVFAPGTPDALRAHLGRATPGGGLARCPVLVPLPTVAGGSASRAARLRQALAACRELLAFHAAAAIVVLQADHILQLDVRQLVEAHCDLAAALTLAALPVPVAEAARRGVIRVGGGHRVHEVQRAPAEPAPAPGSRGFALCWAGDLVLDPSALPDVLDALPATAVPDEADLLDPLVGGFRVVAYDVLEIRLPGSPDGPGAYVHEPTTLEVYYAAQMDLCTPRPALDLYNTAWPVVPAHTGLGPAKVVADAAGRAGQALNTLVSDGAVIRGGVAINSVLGHGVMIESGAEVEDSVLLDGCRIGCGARVRRAVVGAGAVVDAEAAIGYGTPLPPLARLAPSGLTVVAGVAPDR